MSKVIIIGGGAAGMMAAISAAMCGHSVSIYEKNEKLGKKLYITGKGRCNLTNASDMENIMRHVISNPRFLYSAFDAWTNLDMMELVENAGCHLKVERGERVFPVSDKSVDVIRALEKLLKKYNIEIRLHSEVKSIIIEEGICRGILLSNGKKEYADSTIVCTGGLSYKSTGSTGDGYTWAKDSGHEIIKTFPSLVPLVVKEDICERLQGLSLRNVRLSITDGKKKLYDEQGEMLFTHFGISGPLVLSASSYVVKILKDRELKLHIDLKPALSFEQLDNRIIRDFNDNINKDFRNSLSELYPNKLIPVMIDLSKIDPYKKTNAVTKEERERLVGLTKNLELTLTGARGYEEAIITKGGISTKDIDPKTMQSKHIKGLYFAGEVLDLDATTGGHNLQIAWSTGYLAGRSIL